jgi:aminomethyltransferase
VSDALGRRLEGFKARPRRPLARDRPAGCPGSAAAEVLGAADRCRPDGAALLRRGRGTVAGIPALVARTGYTGEDGFEVFVDTAATAKLWDALLEAVQAAGGGPVGLGARDTLRLEAGMPLYGNELDLETNPYEAGLGRVVKLAKPDDFVGRGLSEKDRRDGPVPASRRSDRGGPRGSPVTAIRSGRARGGRGS